MRVWTFWKRRWANMVVFVLVSYCCFNFYILIRILSRRLTVLENVIRNKSDLASQWRPAEVTKDGVVDFAPEVSMCSYRKTAYVDGSNSSRRGVLLNQPPFDVVTSNMKCLLKGIVAVFGKEFALLNNAMLDPSKINSTYVSAKGGEKMEDVWDQPEDSEYLSQLPGYFTVPCQVPPILDFDETDFKSAWAKSLRCYKTINNVQNDTDRNDNITLSTNYYGGNVTINAPNYIPGLTIAITRYEYANFYHTMTDIYNAFVVKLLLSTSTRGTQSINILFVDAHPQAKLDDVWSDLFGKVLRAGRLQNPTTFEKLVWGIQGYRSLLNNHHSTSVPYLEEFRHFFLTRHGLDASSSSSFSNHEIDCLRLNVIVILRHDHVTHPRNRLGKVVRKFSNEDEIIKTVKDTLDSTVPPGLGNNNDMTVRGVAMETLSMRAQLDLIRKCDILVGMHGAGLTHGLFLPRGSGLVELLPSYSSPDLIHFQAVAQWRGLRYRRWHNVDWNSDRGGAETDVRPRVVRTLIKSVHAQLCSRA